MTSIGRYQLVEKLGQGGMGVVYRAFDTLLQRVVAVKVISGTMESGTEQRERFFREARAAGQLSHRNIITIHDLGEQDGQPYLAMEYLEGEDFQRRLMRPERMSLHRKVELAIEICEGLEYAHARGVIHRDIKPANIFITDNGTAKILDFGLARLVTSEMTNSNMMMGTINYMAPEQVRGERADQRSDIFSVGVVLYELLGGRKAFEGESVATTLYRILQEPPEPLLQIDPSLPPGLVAIVDRALAKPRDERYQAMSEMLRDLAVFRQQMAAHDTPSSGRMAVGGLPRPSDPPRPAVLNESEAVTIAHAPTPFPPVSAATPAAPGSDRFTSAPTSGASAGPAPRPASRRVLWVASVAAIVVLAAAGFWMWRPQRAPSSETPSVVGPPAAAQPRVDETALATALRQAGDALEAGDFDAAERHVTAALALVPDHPEARRLRDRVRTARESVARRLENARAYLTAGRFEDASREAGAVLGIAPGHSEARRLMQEAAVRSRGRGAADARTRMVQAKNAARAAAAPSLVPEAYGTAIAAERTAQRLFDAGQLADATARFYEASGLFRSAEVAAQSEATSRAQQAEAARLRDDRAREVARATIPEPPPVTSTARPMEPPATAPPTPPAQGTASPPPPTAAPPAAPSSAPAKPTPTPEPSAESLVADLLARYDAALEARSLQALKRLWPGLSGNQETAIRDEFDHATRIVVEVVSPHIEVSGATAVATFTRRYELTTVDGQRLRSQSLTTMTVRRMPGGWVIEQVRFDPIR